MLFREGYVWFEAKEIENRAKSAWRFYENRQVEKAPQPLPDHKPPCCVCVCEA
ncbi:hypothetical protein [Mesobacillus foraminis]|uniref:Uncharacterized protein n=1 Tax=Mesobacillus foraminis TaxID=279826 RepID=A0A4R2BF60_9BACI|nr:hypothetical protein [Mesobacillus foraminis]TCN25436.1 hypothetical protein EV146_10592 [Mesobacillus foraminis]